MGRISQERRDDSDDFIGGSDNIQMAERGTYIVVKDCNTAAKPTHMITKHLLSPLRL
jgi:hypothetical protein